MTDTNPATLKQIAKIMRDMDFCMFTTATSDGGMYARPMSNNREVEFDGDVWFFSRTESRKVSEIKADPRVHLSYIDTKQFRFISFDGVAELVTDVAKKRALWDKELARWFEDGPEGDDVMLIKVRPKVIAYWTGEGDGELKLDA